jgi:hypothetical protein
MPDLPVMKSRDMSAHLTSVANTHEQIMQGIHERAAEHDAYRAKQDEKLNAGKQLKGY